MNAKEELGALRTRIDEIDALLVPLFKERMEIAGKVAEIKARHKLPIMDAAREQQVVDRAASMAGAALQDEAAAFMRAIMALSRDLQEKILAGL